MSDGIKISDLPLELNPDAADLVPIVETSDPNNYVTKQTTLGAILRNLLSTADLGAPGGVASLDSSGKVPAAQLPANIGSAGETGPTGPQGTPGLRGATGPQGETGPSGLPGTDGAPGADGAEGATGPEGATGIGQQGPQGLPGVDGDVGATGPRGPAGATGPRLSVVASTGPDWIEIGGVPVQAAQGVTGPTGAMGATGPAGFIGRDGETGPSGPRGSTGPQGDVGATGAQGPTGAVENIYATGVQFSYPTLNLSDVDAALRIALQGGGGGSTTSVEVALTNSVNRVERGSSVSTVVLSWSVTGGTIDAQTLTDVSTLDSAARYYNFTGLNLFADKTWTLTWSATSTTGDSFNGSNTTTVLFSDKIYWGTSASTTLTNAQIQALSNSFSDTRVQTRTFNPAGKYIFFAWPVSYGPATYFKFNGFINSAWEQSTVNFTNASGATVSYYVYRSTYTQSGTGIQIEVN